MAGGAAGLANPERILGRFDLFSLTSDTEQMPNSVLEAMCAGRAVVATDVGDIKHLVTAENAPFIVPCDPETAITEAMLQAACATTWRAATDRRRRRPSPCPRPLSPRHDGRTVCRRLFRPRAVIAAARAFAPVWRIVLGALTRQRVMRRRRRLSNAGRSSRSAAKSRRASTALDHRRHRHGRASPRMDRRRGAGRRSTPRACRARSRRGHRIFARSAACGRT